MKRISATNARKQLFDLIEQAGRPGVFIGISHRDLPDVVMMSVDEFEGWIETMEIMASPTLVKKIEAGLKEVNSGQMTSLEDVKKKLKM
ncbi:type II toxin-antitoxin system Phd/YefM family antitoxin [Patescibacteria group bacterium]|nr:type II toxin-antitoxin system Phd/YefM family antitoxin [Patescibacteria group bacterium]MBU1123211.1 type II toxin-antitoxin system Phd/YefM family antitoxin [Patescibacteria group bacterium]MBU1910793.1 type II toxin-antitoxin system Phd/YefM family antitoxin [Patescibacteria group bacterium]